MDYGGVRDLQGKRQMPAVQGIREDPPLILFSQTCPTCQGDRVCITCAGSGKKKSFWIFSAD
jgi:hypothetical protein